MSKFWDKVIKFFSCGSSNANEKMLPDEDDAIITKAMIHVNKHNENKVQKNALSMQKGENTIQKKHFDVKLLSKETKSEKAPASSLTTKKTLAQRAKDMEAEAKEFYDNAKKLKEHYKRENAVIDHNLNKIYDTNIGKILEPVTSIMMGKELISQDELIVGNEL